jgi:flagellar biosynthesis/type III secretory pathway protein FliH
MAEEAAVAGVAQTSADEARSVLASLITQLLALARQIIDHALKLARQIIIYASEHPLAMILLVANICIWVS